MSKAFGQTVVIDNRAGGNTVIQGQLEVAKLEVLAVSGDKQFAAYIRSETERMAHIIKLSRAKVE